MAYLAVYKVEQGWETARQSSNRYQNNYVQTPGKSFFSKRRVPSLKFPPVLYLLRREMTISHLMPKIWRDMRKMEH